MAAELTTAGYIGHHLAFLKTGDSFWHVHLDTLLFSIISGAIFLFVFFKSCKKSNTGCA
ncbi:ATP synthase subunit a [Pasteurella multocida]|nr:ATP synthase subunit a [Pasteurella multocida]